MIEKLVNIRWKSGSEDGLEAYMAAQKIGYLLRKVAKTLTMHETITQDGDTYTLSIESTFTNHKMEFKLGEPFVDHGFDGRDMNVTFFIEGEKLIATLDNIKEGDVPARIERFLRPDGNLEITFISVPTNTTCVRVYTPEEKK